MLVYVDSVVCCVVSSLVMFFLVRFSSVFSLL